MKIQDLKVFIVGVPPKNWGGRYFTFVKLTTSNGIVGYGEVYCDTFGPKAMTAMIEDTFQRYVLGMNPFDLEAMWRKAYMSGYTLRPDASLQGVMSGLEIALWDIIGKATGRPVFELLGGRVHEKLRPIPTFILTTPRAKTIRFSGMPSNRLSARLIMPRWGSLVLSLTRQPLIPPLTRASLHWNPWNCAASFAN